ncbi:uncharacterized protein LOC126382405 isoform X2 [Pectinophora gossypiella]|uniref:uncharacterized protein LOC126382405 isoform X2 n=1 Tax=Pectinophora gossypiella TaxID=13191 RepID=UPI00214EDB90|nr:uncharacterized protein LOC126382405 isoform X2 [Pectinophora gossypiella]
MLWLLKLSIVLQCVQSVRIINIRVPEVIQYGTRDAVTLDCDYVTGNVTGLVVKWFYVDKSQPVYQWIPPQKPQALGLLKNKLDLTYKVSRNPYTQHRALRILNPGLELTGNYTCVVSTFLAEDERTKPMTIFVPERRFDMIQDRLGDGYLNIICSAEGVFPKPELVILAGNRPLHAKSQIKLINDRYTAVTSSIVKIDSLPPTVEILCDMHVPLANYFSRKRDIFYRDPPPTTPDPPNSAQTQARDNAHRDLSTPMLLITSLIYIFVIHIR